MALHEGLHELGMAAISCMMNLLFTVTHQHCFRQPSGGMKEVHCVRC